MEEGVRVTATLDEAVRAVLDAQPWEDIYKRLTAYAQMLLNRAVWRGKRGGLVPGGREAEDLASEAILDIYSGTREWDMVKQPDLEAHLRSVVKSEVSSAYQRLENKEMRQPESEEIGAHSDPDDTFFWAFLDYLDEPLLRQAVECIYDGHTERADIAARLGLSKSDMTNLRKRLSRKLTAFRNLGSGETTGE